jgi:GT2 family glycosyltransferase
MDNRVKSVSVITLNYNTTNHTIALLKSIERIYGQSLQVIVVDNGSTENPAGFLASQFPWIDFIRSDRNLGFAGGNNLAMRAAQGEYLFFVNNDTEFGADILSRMVNLFEQFQGIGLLCPTIHYYDQRDQVQYAGFTQINKITGRNACLTKAKPEHNGMAITHYAHGAAMLVPRRVIDQIGYMPENYFLYYEELDWSESIRRAGYQIVVDTQSAFYHKESRSIEKLFANAQPDFVYAKIFKSHAFDSFLDFLLMRGNAKTSPKKFGSIQNQKRVGLFTGTPLEFLPLRSFHFNWLQV